MALIGSVAGGQTGTLTLTEARDAARRVSPDIVAAREAIAVARGLERQAGAYPNPALVYSHEQANGGGTSSSQHIAVVEQPIDFGGVRGARREAARLRRESAEVRLATAGAQLDYEVTRAYAQAVAADRRARLAAGANEAFARALGVSRERLAAGDVSRYADRRLRLEAARYAALGAEAALARRSARLVLASLIASDAGAISPEAALELVLADSTAVPADIAPADSLIAMALRSRSDLQALELERKAAEAEARLVRRERIPLPTLSAGIKTESISGVDESLTGLAAGVSLPLPLWDRRQGAVAAADAETRRRDAEMAALRRRIAREVIEARDAWAAAREQIAALAPHLGTESGEALQAAQVAYTEGEISLVEWLDAVRAYQEAEASVATVRAELLVRLAALERAAAVPLIVRSSTTRGSDAAAPKE